MGPSVYELTTSFGISLAVGVCTPDRQLPEGDRSPADTAGSAEIRKTQYLMRIMQVMFDLTSGTPCGGSRI